MSDRITLNEPPKHYQFGPFITNVPVQVIGLEASLSPFIQNCTAQRITMFSSHCWQALNCDGVEYPRISSSFENQFMRYSFNTTKRKKDAQIFANIPKFANIGDNPSKTIILTYGNEADYINLTDYTALSNGYGYMNKFTPAASGMNLSPGSFIDKDTELSFPPSHKNGLYCQGINANFLCDTLPHAAEDAIVISESLAKKCEHLAIEKYKIRLGENDIPLNLFGTPDDPKVIPEIGQAVKNNGGILMAIRKKGYENFANLMDESFQKILPADDRVIKVEDGSIVIDIQVYFSPKAYWNIRHKPGTMAQLMHIQEMHYHYYDKVIAAYEKLRNDGCKITANFNDLVTECYSLRKQKRNKSIGIVDKRIPIKNCVVEITVAYKRKINRGDKFAGRAGDKGVVSAVWPDAYMPIDDFGIRADVIMSPDSICNRNNPAQLFEQFYNRLSALMHQRLLDGEFGKGLNAYTHIMDFIKDVHLEYGLEIEKNIITDNDKIDFVDDIIEEGFYFIFIPFSSRSTLENVDKLATKYNYQKSPISFKYEIDGVMKSFRTKKPKSIGSKYVYLLGKIPEMQLSAHEMTHINQMGIPIKSKRKDIRMQHRTNPTPIQFGEDEIGLLSMFLSSSDTARFAMSRSGAPLISEKMCEALLKSKNPSNIGKLPISTEEIIKNSNTIKFLYHMFGVAGYDLTINSSGRK